MRLPILLFAAASVFAQAPAAAPKPVEPAPIVRKHSITLNGKTYAYSTTAGRLPITNDQGDVEAQMFFVAYTLDNPGPRRPLMFSFNGGPGSASVWLHMGLLGPKIVKMQDDGSYPPPPFELVDNPQSFLPFTDVVFIDPVGTGYSRATKAELGKKFFGVQGDIASVGEFIRLWLSRYQRWNSPLFMIGESYGTFRAAGVAGYLVDRGVAFNGICLISSILNFQTARFAPGNDLPYSLFLPTYTAIAWYHKKLEGGLQADLREAVKEAQQYAGGEYVVALAKGDRLTAEERGKAVDKLHRLTGLSKRYLEEHDLRIEINHFTKELLRDRGMTVGRLDGRIIGVEGLNGDPLPEFDPSMTAIRAPYTALFNEYARRELGYESDLEYYILGGGIGPWDFGQGGNNRYAETAGALRQAFAKNPFMRVYVGSGYYDLATPFFATEYTFSHMGLPSKYKPQVTTKMFPAGHMFYVYKPALAELAKDIEEFVGKR
ncbi:MAG: peptidase S10 [Acidobacteria bacterium]|nr:peptidase S10 [Acidobacteriota bacterium]